MRHASHRLPFVLVFAFAARLCGQNPTPDTPPGYVVVGGGPIQANSTLYFGANYNRGFNYFNVDNGWNELLPNLTMVVSPFATLSNAHGSNISTVETARVHVINQGVILADNPVSTIAMTMFFGQVTNGPFATINGHVRNHPTVAFGYLPLTVLNQGTINGNVTGANITNEAGAVITGTVTAAVTGDTGTLVNYGTIGTAGQTAISDALSESYHITNETSGVINGDVRLDEAGGTFVNRGTINGNISAYYGGGGIVHVTLYDTTVFGAAADRTEAARITLAGDGTGALPMDHTLKIGSELIKSGSGTWTLQGVLDLPSAAILTVQGGSVVWGNPTVNGSLQLRLGGNDFDVNGNDIDFTQLHLSPGATLRDSAGGGLVNVGGFALVSGGTISAALRLNKFTVSGAVSLSAPIETPSFVDLDIIGGGSLTLNAGASLPAATELSLAGAGSRLNLNGRNQVLASISGDAGTVVDLGSGNLTVQATGNTTFRGTVQGSGLFTKLGTGTASIGGNGLAQAVEVKEGTLRLVPAAGTLGGTYHVWYGAKLELDPQTAAGEEAIYAGGIGGGGPGSGEIVKSGTGTLRIMGPNTTFTTTTVQGGRLIAAHSDAIGTMGVRVTGSGSELEIANVAFDRAVMLANGGALSVSGTGSLQGSVSGTNGHIILRDNATASSVIHNDGTLTLRGQSSASGSSIFTAGTVSVEDNATLGSSFLENRGTLQFKGAGSAGATEVFNDSGARIDLSGAGTATPVQIGRIYGGGDIRLGGGTLQFGGFHTGAEISGTISDGGAFGGTGGRFIKTDFGSLSLTGANTYTGGTTVRQGYLLANNTTGSAVGSGPVLVEAGATIGGSGFIGGFTTIANGGRIAPGNSIGTLTFANGLTLQSGTMLNFELGATSDLLRITGGNFSVVDATFNFTTGAGYSSGTFTLIDWTGATAGGFAAENFVIGTVSSGNWADYTLTIVGSTLQLTTMSAIPEPSTYAALLGLAVLACAAERRRRGQSRGIE